MIGRANLISDDEPIMVPGHEQLENATARNKTDMDF